MSTYAEKVEDGFEKWLLSFQVEDQEKGRPWREVAYDCLRCSACETPITPQIPGEALFFTWCDARGEPHWYQFLLHRSAVCQEGRPGKHGGDIVEGLQRLRQLTEHGQAWLTRLDIGELLADLYDRLDARLNQRCPIRRLDVSTVPKLGSAPTDG